MDGGVRSDHMVVGQQVAEAQGLHPLTVGAHRSEIGPDLGLG